MFPLSETKTGGFFRNNVKNFKVVFQSYKFVSGCPSCKINLSGGFLTQMHAMCSCAVNVAKIKSGNHCQFKVPYDTMHFTAEISCQKYKICYFI